MSKEELRDEQDAKVAKRHEHDDDVIVAPEGSKRGRFLLAFLLAILVLTTFSVSDEVVGCFTGRATRGGAFMTFQDPVRGDVTIGASEFQNTEQNYAKVMDILVPNRDRSDRSAQETAEFLVLDSAAVASGVHVTDEEIAKLLLARLGDDQTYSTVMRRYRTSKKDFEEMLRRMLRVERYKGLLSAPLETADPAEVLKLWKARHQEYAFDYAQLAVDTMSDEARKEVPDAVALEAWFKTLPEPERNKYKTQETARAEVAFHTLGPDSTAEQLLAKYPPPAEKTPEERAQDYYAGFRHVRFVDPDYKFDPQKGFNPDDYYLKFDAVKDLCMKEAPVYDALSAWIADMQARLDKNENVSLIDEASALRLGYRNQPEPMTRADFAKDGIPGWGRYVSEQLFSPDLQTGKLAPAVVVEKNAFAVVRLIERSDSRMPEFPEIQARVQEEWVKKKAQDLALAKLESLRDQLGTRPAETEPGAALWRPEVDVEKFTAVAKAAGIDAEHRDWQEKFVAPKAGETPTPAQTFLQQAGALYTMKENSVAKAEPSRDGNYVFLVRIAGIRDADVSKMTPGDWQTFSQQSVQEKITNFRTNVLGSKDYFKEHYKLHLRSEDEKKNTGS